MIKKEKYWNSGPSDFQVLIKPEFNTYGVNECYSWGESNCGFEIFLQIDVGTWRNTNPAVFIRAKYGRTTVTTCYLKSKKAVTIGRGSWTVVTHISKLCKLSE